MISPTNYADVAPVSGAGISHSGKFFYGYATSPGKGSSMEDFYETRIDSVDGEIVGLFGVFDGHGGARAAEYVKQNLFSNLIRHPKFISDTKSAIADAYNHTDSEFLKSENNQNRESGSTASTAILIGDRLLVANVGDSRAVTCRGGNAIAVSRDHKPDQTDERQRIEDAGGLVTWAGTWKVGGVLAVSRAFGDRLFKQYVIADPEIQEEKIDSSLEFLILASYGLWDVVTNEEAVVMTKPIEDPELAAKSLLQEAYQRGSAYNITCIVVRFLANQGIRPEGIIGMGMVVRDEYGNVLMTVAKRICASWESNPIEVNALKFGLELAFDPGFRNVQVVGDNQPTIMALQSGPVMNPFHDLCVADILDLSANFNSIQFIYSSRAANNLAHRVAKEAFIALNLWLYGWKIYHPHLALIAAQDASHVHILVDLASAMLWVPATLEYLGLDRESSMLAEGPQLV
ncbi:hypothetical protein GH714_034865 [Hevea brasiliensis]|uniref:protein-serine/threonine phosphatase n=1 Tax=Hevea brasiliensis TaxID=3981 RepID=A0A6A6NCU4_HEVBR|nr:hypothetical protein GH714_034865 [Hevea brasiliensis]